MVQCTSSSADEDCRWRVALESLFKWQVLSVVIDGILKVVWLWRLSSVRKIEEVDEISPINWIYRHIMMHFCSSRPHTTLFWERPHHLHRFLTSMWCVKKDARWCIRISNNIATTTFNFLSLTHHKCYDMTTKRRREGFDPHGVINCKVQRVLCVERERENRENKFFNH